MVEDNDFLESDHEGTDERFTLYEATVDKTNLPNLLRKAGVTVYECDGWSFRGSSTFSPRGVLAHHTGPGSVDGLVKVCINGRTGLPGPLAHVVLAPDGSAYIVAAGKANHAGVGTWRGLSGNTVLWGIEAVHPGNLTTPWPEVQLQAYYKICAVMLKMVGAGAEMVAGHKEYATPLGRKIDPSQLDMNRFRTEVGKALIALNTPVEVKAMFDPPLSIVAWTKVTYGETGVVGVNAKGEIFAEPTHLYLDAPANHPEYWQSHGGEARDISSVPNGYQVIDQHGHGYTYNVKI